MDTGTWDHFAPVDDSPLHRDALRYRWLREHADTILLKEEVALCKETQPVYVKMIGPQELDEAIDYGRRAPRKAGDAQRETQ